MDRLANCNCGDSIRLYQTNGRTRVVYCSRCVPVDSAEVRALLNEYRNRQHQCDLAQQALSAEFRRVQDEAQQAEAQPAETQPAETQPATQQARPELQWSNGTSYVRMTLPDLWLQYATAMDRRNAICSAILTAVRALNGQL